MSKKLPIVAIVGRANVGKSSLFNAILQRREAIVAQEAGTTRDSVWAKASWVSEAVTPGQTRAQRGQPSERMAGGVEATLERSDESTSRGASPSSKNEIVANRVRYDSPTKNRYDFWLVDTAGMKSAEDEFEFTIQEQIAQAADSADIIWVVVEANASITEEDRRIARIALKTGKPVFLIINKVDRARGHDLEGFDRLGIKPIFPTSTTQNRGISDLLDALVRQIPQATLEEDCNRIRLALLGRPNVGKSALFNTLAKKQQAIVADRAGTTRDVNRTTIKYQGCEIELMDTAGIRRSGKIGQGIEHFSVIRSLAAIEQADVCLLLMDVNELNTGLDQKIAGMIEEAGKGLIIIVSKWDSVEGKTAYTRDALAPQIAEAFNFVPWAPLIFTSSVTGQNVAKIFDLVLQVFDHRKTRISTSRLNEWLNKVISKHPPAGLKNRAPKLNYMVQEDDNPTPAFKIFGAHTKFLHWSYKRYMERELRQEFNFDGTAVQLWFIEKSGRHAHGNSPTKPERSATQRKIVRNKRRAGKL
ncbi:ribosome biogenesis GTPase Der [Candidatus Saccharibacteria bacterium]|nr:ribosome biogenesis GTPase Der [Candidatus Saccharibacteria bacterium]